MGTAASSWLRGKIPESEIKKIEHDAPAKHPQGKPRFKVACHECADGVLRPHGAFGLCMRHYALFRRATVKGDCTLCPAKDVSLGFVDPPVCLACYRKQRKAMMSEADLEHKRRVDREHHRRRNREQPGLSTAYYQRIKRDDPEKFAACLANRRVAQRRRMAKETPEQREARLAKNREYRRNLALGIRPEKKKPAPVPRLPQKTRVTGLSRYLHVEPEVTTRKLPEQTGVFTDALAARRAEVRPDKKYRARPRAA